jgi:hypothetical protein
MNDNPSPRRRSSSDELHPGIYIALICVVAWFAIAVWGFDADPYTAWLLVVISGFAMVAVAIPAILSGIGHDPKKHAPRLRDWLAGDFAVWGDKEKSTNAAIEILLPLGAAAIGMTAIAIVFMAEHSA